VRFPTHGSEATTRGSEIPLIGSAAVPHGSEASLIGSETPLIGSAEWLSGSEMLL